MSPAGEATTALSAGAPAAGAGAWAARTASAVRRPSLAAAALLAAAAVLVFGPAVRYEFVDWDTFTQVVDNVHIRGLTWENVRHILTTRCIYSYYPVRTLTFALDYQISGLDPWAYKATNIAIHVACVWLVLALILRLFRRRAGRPGPSPGWDVWAAAVSAGVYALHPVMVEPVVWVAGREELLMTLGALACVHLHWTARGLGERGRRAAALACDAAALLCCIAACLSNAVGAIIPALVVASDLVLLETNRWRRTAASTAPLLAVGVITILVKRMGESDIPIPPPVFSLERLMLVLHIYWLNVKSLFWPTQLCLFYDWVYPRSFLEPPVLAGAAVAAATLTLLWLVRRRRLALLGLLWFGLAMGPVSQIMPHHIQRADRYFYLPLAGLALSLAVGLRSLAGLLHVSAAKRGAAVASLLLLAVLGVLSAGQVTTWRNSQSAWEQCLWINPDNARAHDAFADNLVRLGRLDQAILHYEKVLQILPNNIESLITLAVQLACGDPAQRDYQRAIRLGTRACELTGWSSLEVRRDLAQIYTAYAVELQGRGDYGQAIQHYRAAIELSDDYVVPYLNLALLLATCPDPTLRRPDEAVRLAERGCLGGGVPDINSLLILATAYAQAGRLRMAALTVEKAVPMAQDQGRPDLAQALAQQAIAYQKAANEGRRLEDIVVPPTRTATPSPEGR